MTTRDKIRLGLIGFGSAGSTQFEAAAALPNLQFVAVAESNPLPEPLAVPVHLDWRRLLDNKDIDAVSICLPHHLHAEVSIAAFEAGKHVLLEKPIGRNAEEAGRIIEAGRAAKRLLLIEMTHRFYPPVRAGRDLVRSGRLGRIYAVEERIIEYVGDGHLPRWICNTALSGGGVALTNGIHMIDRTAWVCGQALRFHHGVAGWSHQLGDIEDTASMQLSLADGTPVNFLASWPRVTSRMDDELTLYGTEGTLRIWAWRGWRFEPQGRDAEEHRSYSPDQVVGQVGMGGALTEFASAILENRPPSPMPEEILAAQEIIDEFYRQVRKPK